MAVILSIIIIICLLALTFSYLVKYFSYSEPEEHLPIENYDLVNKPTKSKKVTKSKTKK